MMSCDHDNENLLVAFKSLDGLTLNFILMWNLEMNVPRHFLRSDCLPTGDFVSRYISFIPQKVTDVTLMTK